MPGTRATLPTTKSATGSVAVAQSGGLDRFVAGTHDPRTLAAIALNGAQIAQPNDSLHLDRNPGGERTLRERGSRFAEGHDQMPAGAYPAFDGSLWARFKSTCAVQQKSHRATANLRGLRAATRTSRCRRPRCWCRRGAAFASPCSGFGRERLGHAVGGSPPLGAPPDGRGPIRKTDCRQRRSARRHPARPRLEVDG